MSLSHHLAVHIGRKGSLGLRSISLNSELSFDLKDYRTQGFERVCEEKHYSIQYCATDDFLKIPRLLKTKILQKLPNQKTFVNFAQQNMTIFITYE